MSPKPILAWMLVLAALTGSRPAAAQDRVRIVPERTDEILVNPGKGFATFQHFNGDPLFPGPRNEQGPLSFAEKIKTLENVDSAL
jgi:hypothetical protein